MLRCHGDEDAEAGKADARRREGSLGMAEQTSSSSSVGPPWLCPPIPRSPSSVSGPSLPFTFRAPSPPPIVIVIVCASVLWTFFHMQRRHRGSARPSLLHRRIAASAASTSSFCPSGTASGASDLHAPKLQFDCSRFLPSPPGRLTPARIAATSRCRCCLQSVSASLALLRPSVCAVRAWRGHRRRWRRQQTTDKTRTTMKSFHHQTAEGHRETGGSHMSSKWVAVPAKPRRACR